MYFYINFIQFSFLFFSFFYSLTIQVHLGWYNEIKIFKNHWKIDLKKRCKPDLRFKKFIKHFYDNLQYFILYKY